MLIYLGSGIGGESETLIRFRGDIEGGRGQEGAVGSLKSWSGTRCAHAEFDVKLQLETNDHIRHRKRLRMLAKRSKTE